MRTKAELRAQAEAAARSDDVAKLSPAEVAELVHELRVHQIELEMQNDELLHTQHTLQASRARYHSLFHDAPIGYVELDSRGHILEANATACALAGIATADVITQPLTALIAPVDQDVFYLLRRHLVVDFKWRAASCASGRLVTRCAGSGSTSSWPRARNGLRGSASRSAI
jgi:PAS domain-containing protein